MMNRGIECLRKIQVIRLGKIQQKKELLNCIFPRDNEYTEQSLKEFEELLVLDIPGFKEEEIREKRVNKFLKRENENQIRKKYLEKSIWSIFCDYKSILKSQQRRSRLSLLVQLQKMGIFQKKFKLYFFNESTQEPDSKIEIMTLRDFLAMYTLDDVEKIINAISDLKWSIQTKKQAYKQFVHFWAFIHEKYLGKKILHGNAKNCLQKMTRRPTNKILDRASIAKLFKEIEKSNCIRELILCRLLFYCGKNISYEKLRNLEVSQIDFSNSKILFSDDFEIQISDEFNMLLKAYIDKKKKYVFRTKNDGFIHRNFLERFIQKKAKNIGLNAVSIETLQKSFEPIKSEFLNFF